MMEEQNRSFAREASRLAVAVLRFFAGDVAGAACMYWKEILGGVGIALLSILLLVSLLFTIPAAIAGAVAEILPELGEGDQDHSEEWYGDDDDIPWTPEGDFVISMVVRGNAWLSRGYHGVGNGAGIDIAAAKGTPVIALYDGTVSYYLWKDHAGNLVSFGAVAFLRQGPFTAIYAHLSGFDTEESKDLIDSLGTRQIYGPDVREFQYSKPVQKGEVIGYVGDTGNSYGNHLHFGLLINGRPMNPLTGSMDFE